MIGYYNYTVILTYLALLSGSTGIFFALNNNPFAAIICLLCAGLFDLFDGKVARTKKDRTMDEKNFGIQIDSLSDLISFGVLPACIGYTVGMKEYYFIPIFVMFILAGFIRLAFFNVRELNVLYGTVQEKSTFYYGMPITMASLLIPSLYILKPFIPNYFYIIYAIFMGVVAILFVAKIKFPKPNKIAIIGLAIFGTLLTIASIVIGVLDLNGVFGN